MWLRITGKPPRLSPAGASITSVKVGSVHVPTLAWVFRYFSYRYTGVSNTAKPARERETANRSCEREILNDAGVRQQNYERIQQHETEENYLQLLFCRSCNQV